MRKSHQSKERVPAGSLKGDNEREGGQGGRQIVVPNLVLHYVDSILNFHPAKKKTHYMTTLRQMTRPEVALKKI